MSSAKSIVHVDITKFCEGGTEGLDLLGGWNNFLSLLVLALSLLFSMEAEVFEENH